MSDEQNNDEQMFHQLRLLEALIFSAEAPLTALSLQTKLGETVEIATLLAKLQSDYAGRGIELVTVAGGYAFRTAADLATSLRGEKPVEARKPPRAAIETLAIVAYHQPVTRAEIEAIRGVQVSRGTLDILIEAGWVRPGRRRETPGRPLTWLTTPQFLDQFGLQSLRDLPGVEELKASGLLDARPVLATLPADPEAAEGAEAREENDHLPAGDETLDALTDEAWEARFAADASGAMDVADDENDAAHLTTVN